MEKITDFCKKHVFIIYGVIILITCFVIYLNNNYTYFWFDEGYTLSLIKHTYSDIWYLTAQDVHPPFYYFLLKAYTDVFGNSVLSARSFSAIPILLVIVVACTLIRKEWGNKAAVFFLLVLITTPMTKFMASEIRMYSWAMFFVLMSFIYAFLSFTKDKKHYFIPFVLFSLMAAYTHYYALLTIFFIYLVFFILSLIYKRDKLVSFIAVSAFFTLGYIPWLMNLLEQIRTVSKDYWIDIDMWKNNLLESIYPLNKIGLSNVNEDASFYLKLFLLLAFFSYASYIAYKAVKGGNRSLFYTALIAFALFLLPAITAIVYTIAIQPVFTPKYVCCFSGLYFIGAALLFSAMDMSKRASWITVSLFLLLSIYLNVSLFKHKFRDNKANSLALSDMVDFIEKDIDDRTAFLYTDSVFPQLAIYPILFPQNIHICKTDPETNKQQAVMNAMNYIGVASFENIDTIYNKLYIADHYPEAGTNLIKIEIDSIEIVQQFEIVGKIERARYAGDKLSKVYKLKRRIAD